MSDGARYEIPHPESIAVTVRHVYVAIKPGKSGLPASGVFCEPLHITRIEPIDGDGRDEKRKGRKKK
jgi:hypothetical protein